MKNRNMKKRVTAVLLTAALGTFPAFGVTAFADGAQLQIHFHSNNKNTILDASGEIAPVFALASEKTGITIENVANPVAQDSLQEFELQATEQFPYDIYGGTNVRLSINSYGAMGAFLPLNDLIEEYAPNIRKFFEDYPEVKKASTAADGNIYSLCYCPDGAVGRTFFIRTDWLKALNLEMPTTFDELEEVLYAFRNEDPNGNGLQDEVPVFNDKWQEAIRLANLWGARVYGSDSFNERIVLDDDGNFYDAWIAPEFKEALIGLHKWYEDGILDPEVFTRKTNTARQTLWTKDNTGGMTHEFFASTSNYNYNEELLSAVPDFKVEAMLPVNKNGEPFEEHHRALMKNDGWAISVNCDDPVAAITFMDWFYSEEGRRAENFGIEGVTYTMVDGKPIFTEETLKQTNVNTYLYNFGAQLPIGYKQDFAYEEQWLTEEGKAANDLYENSGLKFVKETPPLSFDEEETEILDSSLSSLNTYQDEMVTAFITGKSDIEAEWDNYVNTCNGYGAEKLVEIYTSAYERYQNVK